MNSLEKQNMGLADPLQGLRDFIIEDNATRTVFALPRNTRILISIETLGNLYKRIKYGVNPLSGNTKRIECYK